MYHYFNAITNTKGDALIGYYVKAVDPSTGDEIAMYADENATPIIAVSGVANACQVDINGNASFYIAGGQYHLDIYATDSTTLVERVENIPMVDFNVAAGNLSTRSLLSLKVAATGNAWTLVEPGREGLFVFDASDLSAQVAVDTEEGMFIAPDIDSTGASGAWVRKFSGPANASWWGASPDSVTNATQIQCAIDTLKTLAVSGGYGPNGGSIGLHIPAGAYEVAAPLTIDHAMELSGDYTGQFSGGGTALSFIDSDGIVITKDAGTARMSGLSINGTSIPGSGKYGLKVRGKIIAQCLFIAGFDHGIDCLGNYGSDGTNTNGSTFDNIAIQTCGWGTWAAGADANNMMFSNVSCISNYLGGHRDASFLGNIYDGSDVSSNGNSLTYPTRCSYSGKIYAVKLGAEVGASTNAPSGTTASNAWWIYLSTGITGPDGGTPTPWDPGLTWYFSAPFCHTNNNARTHFRDLYVEFDQNPCIITWPCSVYAGQQFVSILQSDGTPANRVFGAGSIAGDDIYYPFQGNVEFTGATLTHGQIVGGAGADIRGNIQFGFPVNPGYLTDADVTIGNWNEYSRLNFARQGVTTATIFYGLGFVNYDAPAHNFRVGPVYVSGGSFGYGAGVGGTIAQGSSKSTGVTLNKVCGQITMHNASLAAAAKASFAVSNSTVAATDTIIVSVASGGTANAYRAAVTAVGASSFTITVENITAGPLSEAPVINFAVIKAVAA